MRVETQAACLAQHSNDLLDLCYRMLNCAPKRRVSFRRVDSHSSDRFNVSHSGDPFRGWHVVNGAIPGDEVRACSSGFRGGDSSIAQNWMARRTSGYSGASYRDSGKSSRCCSGYPRHSPQSREVAVETSAYRDTTETYTTTDKTLCSSGDERSAGIALELTPPRAENRTEEILRWFDLDFWPIYPRKVGKPQALKAARRHAKTATDRAAILECLNRRLPSLQAQFRTDGDFRPYPASGLTKCHGPSLRKRLRR